MIRKQLDPRIHTLIRNNVATNHRSFFVLVGDRARDQVITLHHLLSQSRHTSRPNVLWCYKKDLGFTTHRKKREAKIKRDIKRGIREKGDAADPFENFVGNTDIRYCYYKDTPKILGRTFGMLILQDFEAITPNTLARTIETVEGGGIVVLMLRTMSSLRQLYSIGMDVHSKYRSAIDPSEPVARFNERFLLSLGANPDTLLLDDELNVLPLSKGKDIKPLEESRQVEGAVEKAKKSQVELKALKDDVGEGAGVADIVKCCKTLDQVRRRRAADLAYMQGIADQVPSHFHPCHSRRPSAGPSNPHHSGHPLLVLPLFHRSTHSSKRPWQVCPPRTRHRSSRRARLLQHLCHLPFPREPQDALRVSLQGSQYPRLRGSLRLEPAARHGRMEGRRGPRQCLP